MTNSLLSLRYTFMDNKDLAFVQPRSARALAKAIFKADVPEDYIRNLPAFSVFLALKANGLESSIDILDILSTEQYRTCLDLDLWVGDELDEASFFNWLALTEGDGDFGQLHRFLKALDMKLVAVLVAKYVHTVILEEATERPPEGNYVTPDKGYSWISIRIEDAERHRLFGKLMAYIFESNAELFYQLISLPSTNTPTELEERCLAERNGRILDEGFPDPESATIVNSPANRDATIASVKKSTHHLVMQDVGTIEPIIYGVNALEPLNSLMKDLAKSENKLSQFQQELTWVTNSALIFYRIALNDFEELTATIEKVRGCINIGLEDLMQQSQRSSAEVFDSIGLREIYRVGMYHLRLLRRQASSVPEETLRAFAEEQAAFAILAGAREAFPTLPKFFSVDRKWHEEQGKLVSGYRAYEKLEELSSAMSFLKETFGS